MIVTRRRKHSLRHCTNRHKYTTFMPAVCKMQKNNNAVEVKEEILTRPKSTGGRAAAGLGMTRPETRRSLAEEGLNIKQRAADGSPNERKRETGHNFTKSTVRRFTENGQGSRPTRSHFLLPWPVLEDHATRSNRSRTPTGQPPLCAKRSTNHTAGKQLASGRAKAEMKH